MQLWRTRKRERRCLGGVLDGGKRCGAGEGRGACGCESLADDANSLVVIRRDVFGVRGVSRKLIARADGRVGVNVSLDDEGLQEDSEQRGKAKGQPAPNWRCRSSPLVASALPHGDVILYRAAHRQTLYPQSSTSSAE